MTMKIKKGTGKNISQMHKSLHSPDEISLTLPIFSPDCFQRDQELACFNASDSSTFWNKTCTPVQQLCTHFNFSDIGERDESMRLTCNNGTHDIDLNNVRAT